MKQEKQDKQQTDGLQAFSVKINHFMAHHTSFTCILVTTQNKLGCDLMVIFN